MTILPVIQDTSAHTVIALQDDETFHLKKREREMRERERERDERERGERITQKIIVGYLAHFLRCSKFFHPYQVTAGQICKV